MEKLQEKTGRSLDNKNFKIARKITASEDEILIFIYPRGKKKQEKSEAYRKSIEDSLTKNGYKVTSMKSLEKYMSQYYIEDVEITDNGSDDQVYSFIIKRRK